jgi:Flp pilus assembly protein TadG
VSWRLLRHFVRDRSAIAVIEFAVVLPLMLALALGTFEASRVVRAKMKADGAAQMMADLIAGQDAINPETLANICLGAQLAMAPYPGASLHAAIASVTNGAVDWTDTSCGAATAIAAPEKLATSLIGGVANSVIIVQTTYGYSSPVPYLLPDSIALTHTAFARPRYGPSVVKN